MPGNTETKPKSLTIHTNQNMQTSWCDSFVLALRDDDMALIRFLSNLPEGHFEQARIMTNKKMLTLFVDQLCAQLNYYPVKPDKQGASN